MSYATLADVKARTTRTFTTKEDNVITALLADAAVLIDRFNSKASADAKMIVSCRMVLRAMGDEDGLGAPIGAMQGSKTAGPYTQSWTVGTGGSTGELYLGRTEKQLLSSGNKIGAKSPLEGMVIGCD